MVANASETVHSAAGEDAESGFMPEYSEAEKVLLWKEFVREQPTPLWLALEKARGKPTAPQSKYFLDAYTCAYKDVVEPWV